jgi:N-acetyl-anhydromuramyl-L-alanine amidase AmpD
MIPEKIIVHCTATPPTAKIESIFNYWHKEQKWTRSGYHFMIQNDGTIVETAPIDEQANGAKGHNSNSIHIAYIGKEINKDQYISLVLLSTWLKFLPTIKSIHKHCEFNPHKTCPNISFAKWEQFKKVWQNTITNHITTKQNLFKKWKNS